MKIIEFDKMKLWDEFKLLQVRKRLAVEKFYEVLAKFQPLQEKQVATANA